MVPLKNLDAPTFYNGQFKTPSYLFLAKTLMEAKTNMIMAGFAFGHLSLLGFLLNPSVILLPIGSYI